MEINAVNSAAAAQYVTQQLAAQQQKNNTPSPTAVSSEGDASSTPKRHGDQVQLNSAETFRNLDTVRTIEQMHARLNAQVKGVRETNEGLAKAAEQMDQMRSTLETITKNFPPFSADSTERQEILMSFVSIRKEMERLMVPPPPPPIYDQVRHLWKELFSENGQMLPTAVPKLSENSNDSQVKDAAYRLSNAGKQIAGLSTEITQALVKG